MKAWCCKCNKPVDGVRRMHFDYMHAYKFQVFCHGECQEQEVPATLFMLNDVKDISIEAFRDNIALPLIALPETSDGGKS